MPNIDNYSLVSIPLQLVTNGKEIGTATGFFCQRKDKLYLVSNWHVFSGRHPKTGQPLNDEGALPDQVVFPIPLDGKSGQWQDGAKIDLGNNTGDVSWLQHKNGQDIDIAVLLMPIIPQGCVIYDAVQPDETSDMLYKVGMDVFVVGFPLGLAKQGNLPVWKRGSVASEPEMPVDNLPLFLVDTATRQGMSGSPVYARSNGGYLLENGDVHTTPGSFTRFLGVYSGRYGADDELAAQLGRVWHKAVLDEVIDHGVTGSFDLRCFGLRP